MRPVWCVKACTLFLSQAYMVALVILHKLLSLELDTHVAGGILLSLYLSITCELINQTVPGIARCHGSLYTA